MAWSPEQISNAKIIISVGRQLGASDRDITIALMAGWQESGLRNLNYGDRDSIGMFQQRNAWGSKQARLDPVQSTRMFFLGGAQGQRGLLDFKNRNSMDLGQAAQKVQVSAFPDAYDKWQDESEQLLKELGSSAGHPAVPMTDPTSSSDPTGPSADLTSPAQQQSSAALTALGVASPTSAGTEAAGVAAASAPGIESADQAPQLDVTGMVDPGVSEMMNIPKELQGQLETPGSPLSITDSGDLSKRVKYSGVTLDQYTLNRLSAANKALGYDISLSQGSYNKGGVAASAGTHDGGGAMDVSIRGKSQSQINAIVGALRQAGFAAWYRTADEGKWSPHIHAIAIGNPWLSRGAAQQVKDYQHGGDGLAN